MEHLLHIVERIERSKHIGPDDDPCGEIAENGSHAEKAADRRSDRRRGKKHSHLNQSSRSHGNPFPRSPWLACKQQGN